MDDTTQSGTSTRKSGIIIMLVSVVVFSFAGIFTRGVSAGAWDIIFWRGIGSAVLTILWLAYSGKLAKESGAFSWPFVLVVLLNAAGTAAFIPAFKFSSVAHVAIIYSLCPLIAAGLAFVFLKELPQRVVIMASIIALGGMVVMFSNSADSGTITGTLLALFMTLMMGSVMVCYRHWPGLPSALPSALSSLVLVPVAFLSGSPLELPLWEILILTLGFGVFFAIASIALMEGAKRLPSAETALLSSLETPLAPVFAFVLLSELPGLQTIIGGTIIFAAVAWSQVQLAKRQ